MVSDEIEEITDVAALGIDESALEWGPDPYGDLARREDADD